MATPLEKWVEEQARLTRPARIHWCDGSDEEARRIVEIGCREEKVNGQPVFQELNPDAFPYSYLHRSHPTDVARTEHLTFVCHPDREEVGPNNNWLSPEAARSRMRVLTDGCMAGRTMYVMPYLMGHPDSPYARACVQLTDISYVAVSMRIMTRMGRPALERIGGSDDFVKGLHSVGDFNPERRFIMHFPEEHFVWSVGSGYGGNALLGKKCFSLRIASWLARSENWLAEHMIIIGIEDPRGRITYVAAALPSACGKTNLAMLESTLPGYRIWTLGDDIAWLHVGPDGRLYALNPEAGFFGVAPGTSLRTNPNMVKTLQAGRFYPTLFTNTGLDVSRNAPWWEGLDETPNPRLDWQGRPWKEGAGPAAHPNARFTVSAQNCPTLSPEYDNPAGVPISAIILGGRRTSVAPLVLQSRDWLEGVCLGSIMGSETTAAAIHQVGQLRRDPMAMLPFCGYNLGDYLGHWLRMGESLKEPPAIFFVNWFRKDGGGDFLWPGFRENIRVMKWIIERTAGGQGNGAAETPIGLVPERSAVNLDGLDLAPGAWKELTAVDRNEWRAEITTGREFLAQFGDRLPTRVREGLDRLDRNLG
ncbi:MAG: Phosphoenolpyruvate carboxykinase (GTP) [candidate division TA06 bacterium ADurb.Bin417]|uniref:Phosphoenolpyruvate carboxykinase [GTP] n=1 Tax=candidate division TA06 bacterium ADurb.Bin417 TaxID=1852828 RepID=A0A1V5MJ51_UNCT6|nr:MAG: Phosphoenolpyruvate carboxykinase (GTP) [candidate division TA06 bacterium ADurb.Bin417]